MTIHLWLRAETKPGEARTALSPTVASKLLEAGFRVTVEDSPGAAICAAEFAAAGCELATPGSWPDAPGNAWILGLKELPESPTALIHRHIYFAHAFKAQQGWQTLLKRYSGGNGILLDLEYLTDHNGRRRAAFGFWAGYVGAALAVSTWCGRQTGKQPPLPPLNPWPDRQALQRQLREQLTLAGNGRTPTVMVIGARGRVGSGATQLANELGLAITAWDIEETAGSGHFTDILQHDLFVNAVMISQSLPPFITSAMLNTASRQLSVIADVSCDPYGDYNPVPLYDHCSSLAEPLIRLGSGVDLIAIDHLPSLLPRESSEDFAEQLLPLLLELLDTSPTWQRAEALFREKLQLAKEAY